MIKLIVAVMLCILVSIGFTGQGQQGFYMNTITLAWGANTESNLAGYNIYVGLSPGGPYDLIGTNEADSVKFTWYNLPDNVDHYFVVTAFNTEGLESRYSNEACGYVDKNHDYGINCNNDYYTDDDDSGSGGGGGCFINVTGG